MVGTYCLSWRFKQKKYRKVAEKIGGSKKCFLTPVWSLKLLQKLRILICIPALHFLISTYLVDELFIGEEINYIRNKEKRLAYKKALAYLPRRHRLYLLKSPVQFIVFF